jgi:hypothetical protein
MQSPVSFSRTRDCGNHVRVLAQTESGPTESERWAWVAGLFEGEGSVIVSPGPGKACQRRLDITNTEQDILEQAIEFSGLGRVIADQARRPGWKQRLYWTVTAWREIEEVANRLYPFLGRRRRRRIADLFDHAPAYVMELAADGRRRRIKLGQLRDPETSTDEPTSDDWWAWAAGLFEGEGSAICRPMSYRRRGLQRRLQVPMSDEDVLLRLRDVVGAGSVRPLKARAQPGAGPRKPMFRWTCSKWSDIERIARRFRPFLLSRRAQQVDWLLSNPIGPRGWANRTYCRRGHPISGPDADVYRYGSERQCRKCHAEDYRVRRQARVRRVAKGEAIELGPRAPKMCKRGHPLEGPNADVYLYYGWRQCRPCDRERDRLARTRGLRC